MTTWTKLTTSQTADVSAVPGIIAESGEYGMYAEAGEYGRVEVVDPWALVSNNTTDWTDL